MKKIIIGILFLFMSFILIYFVIPHYQTKDGISILGYHGVVSDSEKIEKYKDDMYTLSESQFERHIKYLYDHGYVVYTVDDIDDYRAGILEVSNKAVILTFDDGYKNFNEVVKPILEKYGYHGTCFVIGKHLEDKNEKFLKHDDIKNDEIGSYYSHSYDLHRKSKNGFDRKIIEDLSFEEIDLDFKKNGADSTYFAFPYGRSVEGIEEVLEKNDVKYAFGYNQFRHMLVDDDPYYLPRYMVVDFMPDWYIHWIVE